MTAEQTPMLHILTHCCTTATKYFDRVYQQLRPAELHDETEVSKPHTVQKFNPLTKELAHDSSSSEGHLPSYHLIVKTS